MPNPPGLGLPNPQAYQAMGSDLVRDQVTGLVWLKSPVDGFHTWDEATRACQDLSSGGEDDFRLPTRLELVTLVDFRYSDPAIDKTAFPGTPSEAFWTSSAVAGTPDHAWYVNFYFGSTDEAPTATASHARCVRGGS